MKLAAAAAASLLALGGCGSDSEQGSSCVVGVYLDRSATSAQIEAVRSKLGADARVSDVTFVTREEALQRLREQYPELVEGLTYNPLSDALEVTVKDEGDSDAVVADLRPAPPGVENVRPCPKSKPKIVTLPFP